MFTITGTGDHSYYNVSIPTVLLSWFFIGYWNKQGWIFILALFYYRYNINPVNFKLEKYSNYMFMACPKITARPGLQLFVFPAS